MIRKHFTFSAMLLVAVSLWNSPLAAQTKLQDVYKYQWTLSASPKAKNETPIELRPGVNYALRNGFIQDYVTYGNREYGINFVWWKDGEKKERKDPTYRNVDPVIFNFKTKNGLGITDDTPLAISVKPGVNDKPYLEHDERKYGIAIKWTDSPSYEWRLVPPPKGSLRTQSGFALYNMKKHDYVVYCPREYGINLGWRLDWNGDNHCGCKQCGGIWKQAKGAIGDAIEVLGDQSVVLGKMGIREFSKDMVDQLPGPLEDIAYDIMAKGADQIDDILEDAINKYGGGLSESAKRAAIDRAKAKGNKVKNIANKAIEEIESMSDAK